MPLSRLLPLAATLAVGLLAASPLLHAASSEENLFDEGNRAYAEGKFKDAAEHYHQALKSAPGRPNVWYNLGNTEYRLGQKGTAALAYTRALELEPAHPEAASNLSRLRGETGARVAEAPRWQELLRAPESWLGKHAVPWIAAGAFWGALFLLVPLFGHRRSPYWVSGIALSLVALWAGSTVVLNALQNPRWIVVDGKAQPRVSPIESAKALGSPLSEGSEVQLLQDRGEWVYVELPDARRGWLLRKGVEPVIPQA